MDEDIAPRASGIRPDEVGWIGVVESEAEVVLGVWIETVDVIEPFGDLAVAFFALGAGFSGATEDFVVVIEGVLCVWGGLNPYFEFVFGFECAEVNGRNSVGEWLFGGAGLS